ncbi:MAG: putative two-component sensor [Frankiales bacterium]|nr:putative two-component sensor [Frankiales bacterium]
MLDARLPPTASAGSVAGAPSSDLDRDEFAGSAPAGAVRRLLDARPAATDVAVALLLDLFTALPLLHRGGVSGWIWLLDQVLVLPLAVRRRSPVAVFAVIAAAGGVQWMTGQRLPADVALLVALYTVAAHEPRRKAAVAAWIVESGVVMASIRFAPTGDGVIGSLVFLSGLVAAAFFLGTSLRTRRAYLASVEDRAVRLEHERDQQSRLSAIAERTRIAREMHDIVAHNLSVMITLADGAAIAHRTDPAAAAAAMGQVSATGRQALAEMRQLLGVLRDDTRDADLGPQPDLGHLDELLDQVRGAGLPVRLSVRGLPQPLPATAQATVYRIVQEALTNTLKHGRDVTAVHVVLDWGTQALEVTIADDGSAAAPLGAAGSTGGLGLAGMRERAALHAGTVSAGPTAGPTTAPAGRGWVVQARLPLGG